MAVIFLSLAVLGYVTPHVGCEGLCFPWEKSHDGVSVTGHPEPAEAEDVPDEGSSEHLCYLADGNLFLPAPCHLPKAFPV